MRASLWIAFSLLFVTRSALSAAEHKLPPLPQYLTSFGAVYVDGYLYVCGGHSGQAHDYSTETVAKAFRRIKIDQPTKWEDLPEDIGVQGLALVAHKGKIYRIGGMQPRNKPSEEQDTVSVTSCRRFDPKRGKWEEIPSLPEGRSSHDAIVLGDKIFVVGGWEMKGKGGKPVWHDHALVMDLSKEQPTWERIKQPFERRALTVAAYNGKVVVIGGLTKEGGMCRRMELYDPEKNTWTFVTDIPGSDMNGFTPGVAVAGGNLYVNGADGNVYRYNPDGRSWLAVAALEVPRFVHRLVTVGDDAIVAVGGTARKGDTKQTEVIVPSKQLPKTAAEKAPVEKK